MERHCGFLFHHLLNSYSLILATFYMVIRRYGQAILNFNRSKDSRIEILGTNQFSYNNFIQFYFT